jgi:muramoyltetrapeptide carboxypeptidase LdcA involved in peptidoglycan recycling
MQKIIPQKLQKGDRVMVVAPSRGLKLIGQNCRQIAEERLHEMGLEVVFAPNTTDENWNAQGCGSIEQRAADMMTAFNDKSIKAIFTVIGGFNSNQILDHLDYDVIRNNPKIFCGFSDITALHGAIYARTGLETYYGPHYSSIGMKKGCEYTMEYLQKMLFSDEAVEVKPSAEWSDDLWFLDQEKREFIKNDGYWQIHDGAAEGTIIGGNLCTFNLLLGTKYRPEFPQDTILLIEDAGDTSDVVFDRNLQALCHQPDFKNVKGMIIGRFQKSSKVTREALEFIINNKAELQNIPVLANVDYGHSTPILTIPLGGHAKMNGSRLIFSK